MPLSIQEISDRFEIQDLLIRYTRAIDSSSSSGIECEIEIRPRQFCVPGGARDPEDDGDGNPGHSPQNEGTTPT